MTAYLVLDGNSNLVSAGTVIADPLPSGCTKVALSDADYAALQNGTKGWVGGVLVDTGKAAAAANETTLRDQAIAAFAANRAFLAIAAPSNAQNAAQIKALTRQVNGLGRLVLGLFDGTD